MLTMKSSIGRILLPDKDGFLHNIVALNETIS